MKKKCFGRTIFWFVLSAAGAFVTLAPAQAVPVVPNFSQGSMTSTTTTKSTINEVINSMDYNTGYQFSISGSGVEVIDNKSVSPTSTGVNATINGNSTTWTGVGSRPDFKQSVPGAAFQYTETYMGPGLSNHTVIQRETIIESTTETTSVFTQ